MSKPQSIFKLLDNLDQDYLMEFLGVLRELTDNTLENVSSCEKLINEIEFFIDNPDILEESE